MGSTPLPNPGQGWGTTSCKAWVLGHSRHCSGERKKKHVRAMTDSWKQWENPKHKAWALLAPRASDSAQPSPLAASSKNNRHLDIINPKQLGPRQLMGMKARGEAVPSLSLQPPSLGTHSQPGVSHLASSSPVCLCLHRGWGGKWPPCFIPPDDGCIPQWDKAWGVSPSLGLWSRGHPQGSRSFAETHPACEPVAPGASKRAQRYAHALTQLPCGCPWAPKCTQRVPGPQGWLASQQELLVFPLSPSPRTQRVAGHLLFSQLNTFPASR